MFYQVNAGATGANALNAYHRRDAGIAAANNQLTGIRAARSQFIKRTAATNAAAEQEVPATAVSTGIATIKRLANAPTAQKAEASYVIQKATSKPRGGGYTAIDFLESCEAGRELLAKMKAADPDRETHYSPDTGRDYIYTGDIPESELARIRQNAWDTMYGATATQPAAQPAAIVEISDAGRELAAQMSEANAAPAPTINVINDKGYEHITSKIRIYSDTDDLPDVKLPDNFLAARAQGKTEYTRSDDPDFILYGDITIKGMIASNPDVSEELANKLTGELGRLLRDPNGTLEERVVNRAKGLELAKYIAENYIDDPVNKQTFLDRAKELANTAEMRDKGYDSLYIDEETTKMVKTDDDLLASWGQLTEKQATDIINRAKNSLDMNAVKEDALNILKKIMEDFVNSNGNLALPK
jgi:hypothetical protein